jgi:hypothetical protein
MAMPKEKVPTSADYNLKNCNDTLRGLAFIHACGVWDEFVDKVYSAFPHLMFIEDTKTDLISSNVISEQVLETYDYDARERIAAVQFGNHCTQIKSSKLRNTTLLTGGNLSNEKRTTKLRQMYNDLFKL